MPEQYRKELDVAVEAVREAAGLCRVVQAEIGPAVIEKKDRSPVTVADYGSQALVCRMLAERFPSDPVIAEEDARALRSPDHETVRQAVARHVAAVRPGTDAATACDWIDHGGAAEYSDRFWTLDPIDGTKGFLRGEQYAVALALVVNATPVVAALACPNLPGPDGRPGSVFAAVRNGGVHSEPLRRGERATVAVRETRDTSEACFCESVESGHSSHRDAQKIADVLGITAEPVRMDSQAKYAVVARGDADLYLRLPTRPGYVEKIWDHAAGWLVVTEAGGRVSDIHGADLDFSQGPRLEANRGVVVSNGRLHDAVLAALREIGL